MNNPRIAFCSTNKGRTQHLKLTLPKNLADNADYDNCVFVVLDYNSPDDLKEYIASAHAKDIESGKLVVYSYPDGGVFQMAGAKNLAHRCGMLENADILVNLDADNFTGRGFASYIAAQFTEDPHCFLWAKMVKHVLPRGINGRIAMSVNAFLAAGGYDEKFKDWAHDDKDMNMRLRRLGYNAREIDAIYLNAVRHTDKMRFREYPHCAAEGYYDEPVDWMWSSDVTIVNFGNFGCGTVFRNFDPIENWMPIVLGLLPTRIFGIGMHKTATTSLHLAMKILGFDSGHWTSAHWAKTIWSEMQLWGKSNMLERSYHLCDLPIPLLFKELDKGYPGSKFILSTLDEEVWVKAAEIHWSPRNKFRASWDSDPFSHKIHQILYGQRTFDRGVFLARYRQHNAEVREYFRDRPQDLLEMPMSRGAGWNELCGFVDRPIPNVEYPHGNPDGAARVVAARKTKPSLEAPMTVQTQHHHHHHAGDIKSFTIAAPASVVPGESYPLTLTPEPSGVVTSSEQIGWACECSDKSSVTVVSTPGDATGMTATMTIPSDTKPWAHITYWCVYRNSDPGQTEALGGPWELTVSATTNNEGDDSTMTEPTESTTNPPDESTDPGPDTTPPRTDIPAAPEPPASNSQYEEAKAAIAQIEAGLTILKRSSNADAPGTIVFDSLKLIGPALEKLKSLSGL